MKYKTKKTAVNAGYDYRISIDYRKVQCLLGYETPVAYTTYKGEWAADIYDYNHTAIITGHAPFGNIRPARDLCQKYELLAKNIRYNHALLHEEAVEATKYLLSEFILNARAEGSPYYSEARWEQLRNEVAAQLPSCVINDHSNILPYEAVVGLMHDDIREDVHASLDTGVSPQEFFKLYCAAHKKALRKEFFLNCPNPTW